LLVRRFSLVIEPKLDFFQVKAQNTGAKSRQYHKAVSHRLARARDVSHVSRTGRLLRNKLVNYGALNL
jgi:hypothetical protein